MVIFYVHPVLTESFAERRVSTSLVSSNALLYGFDVMCDLLEFVEPILLAKFMYIQMPIPLN